MVGAFGSEGTVEWGTFGGSRGRHAGMMDQHWSSGSFEHSIIRDAASLGRRWAFKMASRDKNAQQAWLCVPPAPPARIMIMTNASGLKHSGGLHGNAVPIQLPKPLACRAAGEGQLACYVTLWLRGGTRSWRHASLETGEWLGAPQHLLAPGWMNTPWKP